MGHTQVSKRGLSSHPLKNKCSNTSTNKNHRESIALCLKKQAEDKRMQIIHLKDYQMQTTWLPLIDKIMADDLNWQKLLYGYSDKLPRFLIKGLFGK